MSIGPVSAGRDFNPLYSAFLLSFVFLLAVPARARDVSVSIRSAGLKGSLRYGHWASLPVEIRKESAEEKLLSGTLRITGAGGFRLTVPVRIGSDRKRRTMRVPVLCSSSFPVFTVRLLDEDQTELARAQRRFRRVLPQSRPLIGLSDALSDSARERIRDAWSRKDGLVQRAPRNSLLDAGRWPGLLDVLYLGSSADFPGDAPEADVRVYRPDRSISTRVPPRIRTSPVDDRAYNLFERPDVSERRRSWFEGAAWIQLFVLTGLFFLCFRLRSRRLVWGLIIAIPAVMVPVLILLAPARPAMIRQQVSFRYHDRRTGHALIDQRAALFPHAGGSDSRQSDRTNGSTGGDGTVPVTYPVRDLKRSIPLFFRESSISERFPLVRKGRDRWRFDWASFPGNGYFVVQHFRRTGSTSSPLSVSEDGDGMRIENTSDRPIRNAWVYRENRYHALGTLSRGAAVRVPEERPGRNRSTREQFLKAAFGPESRRDRTLRKTLKYMLDRYPAGRSFVVGIVEHDPLNPVPPGRYEDRTYPELLVVRVR